MTVPGTILPSSPDSASAMVLAGPVAGYQILGEIGRGGMGVVYKALQPGLNRVVAIKMILSGAHLDPQQRERLRGEARAVARLHHPNIVQVHELNEHQGQPFLCLEYVDGTSLDRKLAGTPQPPRQAAELTRILARAVAYAHQCRVIHRDLKPSNILLAPDGTPRITDFGLAKQLDEEEMRTQSGSILGTPCYMAPEQASGRIREVGPAADIYSLGTILYELLTGRVPFRASSLLDILEQVRHLDPVPPGRLEPGVARDLETICLKCLEKDPRKRYASAEALAEDLDRFLGGEPILARPTGRIERVVKWSRRHPGVASSLGIALLATLALIAVLASSAVQIGNEERATRKALESEREARTSLDGALRQERKRSYFQGIALAERYWLANNVPEAQRVLGESPPEYRAWEWHYLDRVCRGERHILRGHLGWVLGVAISPDGRQIVSAGKDGSIRVWDSRSGQLRYTLDRQPGILTGVAFSPDGRRLISIIGHPHLTRIVQGGAVTSGTFFRDPQNVGQVHIWDASSGQKLAAVAGFSRSALGVACHPAGDLIAIALGNEGGQQGEVRLLEGLHGKEVGTLKSAGGPVLCVAFSPDGRFLASGEGDGSLRLWQVSDAGRKVPEPVVLTGHTASVTAVSFAPNGNRMASASEDGTVRLWDLTNRRLLHSLRGNRHGSQCLAFSRDGRWLASDGENGMIRVGDASTGEELFTLAGHSEVVDTLAFSRSGNVLVSGSVDTTVRVWDLDRAPPVRVFRAPGGPYQAIALSADGRQLASVAKTLTPTETALSKVTIWDVDTCKEVELSHRSAGPIHSLAFSPDGNLQAVVEGDPKSASGLQVKVVDRATGRVVQTLKGVSEPLTQVYFSPDGKLLAARSLSPGEGKPGEVMVWQISSGDVLLSLRANLALLGGLAFRPDGKKLAIPRAGGPRNDSSGELAVVDVATGTEDLVLRNTTGPFLGVAWSPGGKLLATCGMDQPIRFWDSSTGAERNSLRGHTGAVVGVAFSPDGERLASASLDRSVRLWDTGTGQEILPLRGSAQGFFEVVFSRDGLRLAAASLDMSPGGSPGEIRIWEVPPLPLEAERRK